MRLLMSLVLLILLVTAGLSVSQAPVVAVTTIDAPIVSQPQYSPGQELVMERGRASQVFFEGEGVYRAEFVGSPKFTKSGDVWVDYVFTDKGNYYEVQHPWSSVRFYDYYTEVWDEEFTEVKIYDDRWVVEYWNKNKWNDTGFWNVIRSYDVVSDGIKVYRTGQTDIGQRVEEYYFRDGSPCKITITQTCDAEQVIRFVWKPTGIVATTEYEIILEAWQPHAGKVAGLNYYDDNGNFVETIRWFDTLTSCNATPIVSTHAQGRKAEVTFGDFIVVAGDTAILDPDTFYPDAHPESTSVDGYARRTGNDETWAAIHDSTGTHAYDNAGALLAYFESTSTNNQWGDMRRPIMVFDTSALPDVCTITDATLSLYSYTDAEKLDDLNIHDTFVANIYSANPASNTALEPSDYLYTDYGTTPYTDAGVTYDDWVVGSPFWNDFVFNATGIAAISKTSVTKTSMREATYDVADTMPAWSDSNATYVLAFDAEQGVGYKPKLVVTYTTVTAPTVVTNPATSVEETTMTLSGNITATGGENCTNRGFQWDIDSGVPYSSNWTEAGNFGISQFTHGLTSLTEGELYYYRAGANNTAGWGWGSENFSLTKPDEPSPFTATAGEEKVDLTWTNGAGTDNITIRGQIGSYPAGSGNGTLIYNGTGTSANHSGLTPGDHWYYRGWSWCTEGGLEQWSDLAGQDDAIPYTTPTAHTDNATDIQATSATLSGNISHTGYINCTERGFDWGLSTGNYSDNWTEVGSFSAGVFTHSQSGFSANTTYYYRAKTQNPAGWAYGGEESFLTLAASPYPGTPINLTLIDLGAVTINASWGAGTGNTTSYLLLVDRDDYPDSANASLYELAYSGNATSANLTGFDLDDNVFYVSLWGYNANGYSENYTTASIGAEINWLEFITESDMETLAGVFENFYPLLLVALLFGLVFWQKSIILYAIGAPIGIVYGLSLATPSADLSLWIVGVAIAVIGTYFLYCIIIPAFGWLKSRSK